MSILDDVLARQKKQGEELRARKLNPRKKNKGGRPKGSKNRSPLEGLNTRQAKYVQHKLEGESGHSAALAAGYSEATARNVSANIETPVVKRAFTHLLRTQVPLAKLGQRAAEMLDATKTIYSTLDGKITDEREKPDFAERRKGLALYSQMADYWQPKQEQEVTHAISERTAQQLLEVSGLLALASLPPDQLAQLKRSHVTIDAQDTHGFNSFALKSLETPNGEALPTFTKNALTAEQASELIAVQNGEPAITPEQTVQLVSSKQE